MSVCPSDPEKVIGLYPLLLPSERRKAVNQSHPTRPPTLSGEPLEDGMKHLITYLTQVWLPCGCGRLGGGGEGLTDRLEDSKTSRQTNMITPQSTKGLIKSGATKPSPAWLVYEGGKTDRQTDMCRQTGRDRQTDRQIDRQTQTDRQMDRQADRQTDRQTDKQTGRQTDRQAETDR